MSSLRRVQGSQNLLWGSLHCGCFVVEGHYSRVCVLHQGIAKVGERADTRYSVLECGCITANGSFRTICDAHTGGIKVGATVPRGFK